MRTIKSHPNTHRVWVEEKIFEEKTKGGLVLPDDVVKQSQNMAMEGRIISMASNAFTGIDFENMTDKPRVGDVVYFKKYDGEAYIYNKKPYRIILDSLIYHWTDDYLEPDDDIC